MSLCLKVYADHYPERLKIAFLINAPVYFSTLLSVFKSALPPPIVQKMICYGEKGWREDLLQLIDADVLPAFLGGKRTDPDGNPLCKTFIKHGEPVPSSYYLCNHQKTLCSDPDALKLTVIPFSQQVVPVVVEVAGSFLEWEFQTKSRDIGFAVHFRERSGSPAIEVVPKQRVDTCYEPEKRLFKCEKSGIYTLVFDNSYSWIYSKEVYYRARLTSSDF
ncbi:unnamed protein product [Larinioides sclopetarius]